MPGGGGFGFPFSGECDNFEIREQTAICLRAHDLLIDPMTGDLVVGAGDLQVVRDVPAIGQEVSVRLQFLLKEWFLDTTQGVPHLQGQKLGADLAIAWAHLAYSPGGQPLQNHAAI